MQMPAYFHRFSFAPTANTVHQPAAMRYDIMTKNKEKKGLRRGMENGGKKNDFFVTSAKLHIPLSWKFSLFEFLTRVHTTEHTEYDKSDHCEFWPKK